MKSRKRPGRRLTGSIRNLLADPNVDVVCIATPDRLHVPQAIDAIRAGKDVYCEKPMGHWTQFDLSKLFYEETRRLKRVVQIGNQGNSNPAWQKVRELVQAGAVGRVQLVTAGFYRNGDWGERMHIPDPEAKPGPDLDWDAFLGDAPKVPFTVDRFFSWRKYLDYAGGPCTDLFPHIFTPFVSAIGLKFPSRVVASGGIFKYTTYDREVPDTFNMCLDYPEKLSVVVVVHAGQRLRHRAGHPRRRRHADAAKPGRVERGLRRHHGHPVQGRAAGLPGEEGRQHGGALAELPELRAHPRETGERRGVRAARAGGAEHGPAEPAQGQGRHFRPGETRNRTLTHENISCPGRAFIARRRC